MSLAITACEYLFEKYFNEQIFDHRDSRLMDKQTKIAVSMVRKLFEKVKGNEISSVDIGVVFLSDIGPMEFISEYTSVLKEKGYVGINPSKFPNIMSATSLARIAIDIQAKGPCVPLLSIKANKHAFIYAIEQITTGRCRAILLIHMTSSNNCFGCFIEDEELLKKRGLHPKLIVSEKGRNA